VKRFELAAEMGYLLERKGICDLFDGIHAFNEQKGFGHSEFLQPTLRTNAKAPLDGSF